LTQQLGRKIQLVGDNIFATHPKIVAEGIGRVLYPVLIKLNQIGTLRRHWKQSNLKKKAGCACMSSHRSVKTEDSFLADRGRTGQQGCLQRVTGMVSGEEESNV
jgi:enolase